eukprot:COSAG01_NODE_9878_length_2314_cov_1.575621_3_plen_72_part_00
MHAAGPSRRPHDAERRCLGLIVYAVATVVSPSALCAVALACQHIKMQRDTRTCVLLFAFYCVVEEEVSEKR